MNLPKHPPIRENSLLHNLELKAAKGGGGGGGGGGGAGGGVEEGGATGLDLFCVTP